MDEMLDNKKIMCDIAHLAFRVVNSWLYRDQQLARDIRSELTSSRQIINEETITDDLVTQLYSSFRQNIKFTLFTPHEENQNGADWYWRIEHGDHAIHALVQAKRVQRTEFQQSDIQGHIDIPKNQLETLINSRNYASQKIKDLEAWYAIYARINAFPKCDFTNLNECDDHRHTGNCQTDSPSVWITKADTIAKINIPHPSLREVIGQLIRLDCILPCITREETGKPRYFGPSTKSFILQKDIQSYDDCVNIITKDQQLLSKIKGALQIYI